MHTCTKACMWQPEDNLRESVFLLPCGSQVYQSWHQTPVSTEAILPLPTFLLFSYFLFSEFKLQQLCLQRISDLPLAPAPPETEFDVWVAASCFAGATFTSEATSSLWAGRGDSQGSLMNGSILTWGGSLVVHLGYTAAYSRLWHDRECLSPASHSSTRNLSYGFKRSPHC